MSIDDVTVGCVKLNRTAELIRADGAGINKYFIEDRRGFVFAMAHIKDGGEDFDVRYDFAGPDAGVSLRAGMLRVDFSVECRHSGERREGFFFLPLREGGEGLLLAFDDNYMTAWEGYFDMLDRYDAKATFFVMGEAEDFCLRALGRGHDIGFHTINHPNLTKLSREEFYLETISGASSFRRAGIPLSSFAYPFGLSDPWMHEALAETFAVRRGFGTSFKLYIPENVKAGYIEAMSIDNIVFGEDADFEAAVTVMLRAFKFAGRGMILPLATHDISDEAQWGIKPGRLEFLLDSARALKLRFYRYSDFIGDSPVPVSSTH